MSYYDDEEDGGSTALTVPQERRFFTSDDALAGDPAQFGWPPTLVLELALHVETPRALCESYGISREQWDVIRNNPHFIADLSRAVEMMRTEGMAFKARAQLQAAALLKESWKLIHDVTTPANVKADLIKYTIRCSGLDASKDPAIQAKQGPGFSITINMG